MMITPTVTLSSSPNPSTYGQTVTLSADATNAGASFLRWSDANYGSLSPILVSVTNADHNINAEFMELVDADHWLISTNGDVHNLPNANAVEIIIVGARTTPTLWFNYRSDFTRNFETDSRNGTAFKTRYPNPSEEGLRIDLFNPED